MPQKVKRKDNRALFDPLAIASFMIFNSTKASLYGVLAAYCTLIVAAKSSIRCNCFMGQ
jgi:hypothetical protein